MLRGQVKKTKLNQKDWKYAVFIRFEELICNQLITRSGAYQWWKIDASKYRSNPNRNQMFSKIAPPSSAPASSVTVLGKVVIYGYATRDEIEQGEKNKINSEEWHFSPKDAPTTPMADAIVKKLDAIVASGKTARELMTLLKGQK